MQMALPFRFLLKVCLSLSLSTTDALSLMRSESVPFYPKCPLQAKIRCEQHVPFSSKCGHMRPSKLRGLLSLLPARIFSVLTA